MKFRISMKAILWTWLFFVLMLVALGYNAYDRLRPDTFIQLASEQLQKNIPHSQLVVGEVDYSFSVDFNIKLKKVTVLRNNIQIAKIERFELKIPWWLLITHKGSAQVNVDQVEILLTSSDVKNIALPVDVASKAPTKIDIEVPNYLAGAQFTLRVKDVSLKSEDASRTYLQISKLLVREFALDKNSAFEIKLPVWFEHNNQTYSSEIWLFGDMTPAQDNWVFNYTGDFKTKDIDAKINFDDVALEGNIKLTLPQFTIDAQTSFMIDKEERGTSVFSLDQASWKLDLDFNSLPLEFLALFEKEILNDYFKKFEGEAQGKVSLWQKLDYQDLFLTGNLTFPGKFKFHHFIQEGNWFITFDNNLWMTRFENEVIKFSKENLISFNEEKLVETRQSLELRDLDFLEVFKFIPTWEKVSKTETPDYRSFSLINIHRGEEVFQGSFEVASNIQAFNYSGNIKSQQQSLKFNLIHELDYSLDFHSQNFTISPGFEFLSPWVSGEGILNVEFSARELGLFPLTPWKLSGRVEGEKLQGVSLSYLHALWANFQRKPKKQEFSIMVSDKKSQFKLIDKDDKPVILSLELNRNPGEKSTATVTYPGKLKKKESKKIALDFLKKDS